MQNNLTLDNFLTRFLLHPPAVKTAELPTRHAAVLVPIVAAAEPRLLLTRRARTLRKHAGQVAFPGGMQDAEDASLIATALREAMEEVAIPPDRVKVLGTLPPVTSSTGFQVTPVVGLIPPAIDYRMNPAEVESLFEMPLQEALRVSRYSELSVHRQGRRLPVWLSWYDDYFIWGMTAGIIRELSLQLYPDVPE